MNLILYIALLLSCLSPGNNDIGEKECCNVNDTEYSRIPLADPFILFHDGTYYAYGTHSKNGIEVYYSDKLQSWKKHTDLALDKKNSYGNWGFWAPEVYYNKSNRKFYMYYSAEEHICVAISDSPLGPFVQNEKKPMREEKSIDSSLFVDEDGTAYLYFVRFTNGNVIWGAQMEDDLMTIKEETLAKCIEATEPWETSMGKVAEGPSVVKQNGLYYLIYSANHFKSPNYGVGYAVSDSPLGKWDKSKANPIFQKPVEHLVGVGHGAMFFDKDGKSRYVFHAHFNPEKVDPRLMYIIGMSISDDGKITMDSNNIVSPQIK